MRVTPFSRPRPTTIVVWALLALAGSARLSGQAPDPRAEFLNALGQFSLALDGTYGDEGARLSGGLDAMAAALARWDASIEGRDRAMAADLATAEPALAARMHLALGGVYLDRLRTKEGLDHLAASRKSDSTRPEAPFLQGLAYAQMAGNGAAATEALQAAYALDPKNVARTYLLARQLLEAHQREAGLALLERVRGSEQTGTPTRTPFIRLELVREVPGIEPFFPPPSYAEGFALLRQGALAQAIAQLRDALRRDPLAAEASRSDAAKRASAAFRDGLVDEARKQLESDIARAPKQAEAHRVLGMIEIADGQTARAVDHLRVAAGINPSDERPRLALANALIESEQFAEAEQALTDTLRALPSSGRAHYFLGLTYQRQGRRAEALRELQAALALKPLLGANTIHRMVAALAQDEQDLDAAGVALEARVDLIPNDHDAHRDLGRVYFQRGEDVQARAEFEIAVLVDPADADAYTSLGQLHLRAGRHADAAAASLRALEVDASHREARYVYATALIRMGDTDEGTRQMQVFQRLQAEDSESRTRAFELGRLRREASVALASGDTANAVTLLRRALVYEPRSAASHLDLGTALLESGEAAEAIDRLTTAAALNAPYDVHRHLARAYAALGQTAQSQQEQATYERLRREAIRRTGRAQ
jgi:tetratricopeptide (TPR) repeat protein